MTRLGVFVVVYLFWLALCGTLHWQWLLTGLLVALLVSMVAGDLLQGRLPRFSFKRLGYFFAYLFKLAWECIKANLDVAWRVVHPFTPINPDIVRIKTSLKRSISKTFLANSITLTPGTLTVDIDGNELLVHWLSVRTREKKRASKLIAGRFEKLIGGVLE